MKALELAGTLESDTADELLCQAYCDHMIAAATELRRLAAVEAELERIKALEPFGYWHQGDSDDESDFFLAGQSGPVGQGCPQCIALYALGSKT